jgi:hypothetical protein
MILTTTLLRSPMPSNLISYSLVHLSGGRVLLKPLALDIRGSFPYGKSVICIMWCCFVCASRPWMCLFVCGVLHLPFYFYFLGAKKVRYVSVCFEIVARFRILGCMYVDVIHV